MTSPGLRSAEANVAAMATAEDIRRFSALQRALPGVSPTVLTSQLLELEADGAVGRRHRTPRNGPGPFHTGRGPPAAQPAWSQPPLRW